MGHMEEKDDNHADGYYILHDVVLNESSLSNHVFIMTTCRLMFISNLRNNPFQQQKGPLTIEEFENTLLVLIRRLQLEAFGQEVHQLMNNKGIHFSSKLNILSPFWIQTIS